MSEGIWFFGVSNSWYVLFVRETFSNEVERNCTQSQFKIRCEPLRIRKTIKIRNRDVCVNQAENKRPVPQVPRVAVIDRFDCISIF